MSLTVACFNLRRATDYESMVKEISSHVIAIIIVAVVHFSMAFVFVACFNMAAANMVSSRYIHSNVK